MKLIKMITVRNLFKLVAWICTLLAVSVYLLLCFDEILNVYEANRYVLIADEPTPYFKTIEDTRKQIGPRLFTTSDTPAGILQPSNEYYKVIRFDYDKSYRYILIQLPSGEKVYTMDGLLIEKKKLKDNPR